MFPEREGELKKRREREDRSGRETVSGGQRMRERERGRQDKGLLGGNQRGKLRERPRGKPAASEGPLASSYPPTLGHAGADRGDLLGEWTDSGGGGCVLLVGGHRDVSGNFAGPVLAAGNWPRRDY